MENLCPSLPPLLIAEKRPFLRRLTASLHVIHFPSELTPFDRSNLMDESLRWPTELLVSNCMLTLELDQSFEYGGFRRSGKEQAIFDAILRSSRGHIHLSVSKLDQLTPETALCNLDSKGHTQLGELHTITGHTTCIGFRDDEEESPPYRLSFLRMSNRSPSREPWVHLKLPEGIVLDDLDDVLAFDDVYGTLLFFDYTEDDSTSCCYSIVQY